MHPRLQAALPVTVYAAALTLTFGYEVFSFHLTIDEENAGALAAPTYAAGWLSQGRWAMGAITLLLPNPVVPVVSTGLGVGLSGIAWWLVCRRTLVMGPWSATAFASLAATTPIFAYLYSFSTIAYGIGIGALAALVFAEGIASLRWRYRIGGVIAGATSIAVYDTFVAVLAALAVVVMIKRPMVRSAALALAGVVAAFIASRVIGAVASWLLSVPQSVYVSGSFDFQGFLAHPLRRAEDSVDQVWQVLSLQTQRVGLHSPYLAVTVIVLALGALAAAVVTAPGVRGRLVTLLALLGLVTVPYLAQAISPIAIPLRSMIYIPVIILVLGFLAMRLRAWWPVPVRTVAVAAFAGLVVLTVLGDATISNRMFAASETSYDHDQALAFDIGREVELQTRGDLSTDLTLVVSGYHGWASTEVTPVRETLGASFFAWDAGSPDRIAAFLRTQGVGVHAGGIEDIDASRAALKRMPNYPAPGWIVVRDGVLLLKFGPKSVLQR